MGDGVWAELDWVGLGWVRLAAVLDGLIFDVVWQVFHTRTKTGRINSLICFVLSFFLSFFLYLFFRFMISEFCCISLELFVVVVMFLLNNCTLIFYYYFFLVEQIQHLLIFSLEREDKHDLLLLPLLFLMMVVLFVLFCTFTNQTSFVMFLVVVGCFWSLFLVWRFLSNDFFLNLKTEMHFFNLLQNFIYSLIFSFFAKFSLK